MSDSKLEKITAKTAAEVCARYEVEEPALELLTDQQTPAEFIEALVAKKLHADACRFLAQALPPREAVWWAWLCAGPAPKGKMPEKAAAALQLSEQWVVQPSQDLCRQAKEASEAVGLKVPAGLVAQAVFFSGESMTPPDLAAVPPPPHLTGLSAANAVILAVLLGDAKKMDENYQQALALGREVAAGTNRWKEPPPPPPPPAPRARGK